MILGTIKTKGKNVLILTQMMKHIICSSVSFFKLTALQKCKICSLDLMIADEANKFYQMSVKFCNTIEDSIFYIYFSLSTINLK